MLRITNSRTSVRYLLNDKPLYPLNLMKLNARTCQGNPTTRKRQTYKQTTKGLTSIRMLVSLTRLFQPLWSKTATTRSPNATIPPYPKLSTRTVYRRFLAHETQFFRQSNGPGINEKGQKRSLKYILRHAHREVMYEGLFELLVG